jgi:hypothetical protein
LLARLAGPNEDGGNEDSPSAARATCTGSRLGELESLDVKGRLWVRAGKGRGVCEESGRVFKVSTVAASWTWSCCNFFRVDRISIKTALSPPTPFVCAADAMVVTGGPRNLSGASEPR